MKSNVIFLFVLLCLLNCSCNNSTGKSTHTDYIVIDLDNTPQQEKEYLSSFFKEVGVIVLETTEKSLLGRIDKMEVLDDYIYILDLRRGLFIFNKQGNFIKKIGDKGVGPGEYLSPSDLSVDTQRKKLYLLDSQTQTVLKYNMDGTFESMLKLEDEGVSCNYIQYFNDRLYTDLYTYDHSKECFLLSEVDLFTGKRKSLLFDASLYNKGWNELLFTEQKCFISQPTGELKYMGMFMDTIYKIDKEKIVPYLVLQSKDLVTKDFLDSQKESKSAIEIHNGMISANKIYDIKQFFESKKYICFDYYKNNSGYTVVYNKDDGATFVTQNIVNDMLYSDSIGKYPVPKYNSFDKNTVYCIEMNTDYSKEKFLKNIKENNLNTKTIGIDKLNTLTEDSNPVIVYYTFDN